MIFAGVEGYGFTGVCNSITSSGYDIQSDHSVAGWLKCQFVRTLKFGSFPFGSVFIGPKEFMVLQVVSKSRLVEEVEAQDEVVTEFIEHMHVVHKFLLADFKWDWVHTQTLQLVP
jgi:hypothetical protein